MQSNVSLQANSGTICFRELSAALRPSATVGGKQTLSSKGWGNYEASTLLWVGAGECIHLGCGAARRTRAPSSPGDR
jgi:hypothetical protein